ncbi:MAG TPA: thioesterase family protein [Candidatus Angelobacter sp.]|nr:thioesterase family protein [Candidatus Angelobacter sp.]
MPDRIFRHQHRVTYSDCTLGNHVYYARYLDILEEVRGEFFRSLRLPLLTLQQEDTVFPVIESRLEYIRAARYDDVLTIGLWLTELDRVRLNFGYHIDNQHNQSILEGSTHHVCATIAENPKRMPGKLTELLAPYLRTSST